MREKLQKNMYWGSGFNPLFVWSDEVKGVGSCNRKQTCYLYNQNCCPHVATVLCTYFGGLRESVIKLLLKSTDVSAIAQHVSGSLVFLRDSKVHLQNNTFTLRNYCKISVMWPIQNKGESSFHKTFVYIT